MSKHILVTGGAGFIGSHLSRRLLERGDRITVLDEFNDFYDPRRKRANVAPFLELADYRLVEGDIRNAALVDRLFDAGAGGGFDGVVHLAARAGVRPSLEEPILYEEVNCVGTLVLLEAARRHGPEVFIFGSSSSVYGINRKVPFAEDDPIRQPISPYATTKRTGELMCFNYHHLYGLKTACLRFFTVYGPAQRPEMAIHKFTDLLARGEKIPVFGRGDTRRDYTFIDDIVDGFGSGTRSRPRLRDHQPRWRRNDPPRRSGRVVGPGACRRARYRVSSRATRRRSDHLRRRPRRRPGFWAIHRKWTSGKVCSDSSHGTVVLTGIRLPGERKSRGIQQASGRKPPPCPGVPGACGSVGIKEDETMKICVVGAGYVGLVTGACLADFGMEVTGVDIDDERVDSLGRGEIPIFEPGLASLVRKNMADGRLRFTTELGPAVEEARAVFIAVGTPPLPDGSADLIYVRQVAESIGKHLNGYKVVVTKSTGTDRYRSDGREDHYRHLGAVLRNLPWSRTPSSCAKARRSMTSCTPIG